MSSSFKKKHNRVSKLSDSVSREYVAKKTSIFTIPPLAELTKLANELPDYYINKCIANDTNRFFGSFLPSSASRVQTADAQFACNLAKSFGGVEFKRGPKATNNQLVLEALAGAMFFTLQRIDAGYGGLLSDKATVKQQEILGGHILDIFKANTYSEIPVGVKNRCYGSLLRLVKCVPVNESGYSDLHGSICKQSLVDMIDGLIAVDSQKSDTRKMSLSV